MEEKLTQIGSKIYSLHKENNLSQRTLAALLNISDKTLSRIERGEAYMDIRVASELSRVMEVPIEYFVGDLGFQNKERFEDEEVYIYYFRLLSDSEKESVLTLVKSIVELRRLNSHSKE